LNSKINDMKFEKQLVRVRTDLVNEGFSVPVGNEYVSDGKFEARWVYEGTKREQFQIRFMGKWLNTESIDFEFDNH
jgi:hypothetical protein